MVIVALSLLSVPVMQMFQGISAERDQAMSLAALENPTAEALNEISTAAGAAGDQQEMSAEMLNNLSPNAGEEASDLSSAATDELEAQSGKELSGGFGGQTPSGL